jgi:hypothetical protein
MMDEDDFWSNWWTEDWQGKPKYSEKTCPSATLSTTKPHMTKPRLEPRTAAVGKIEVLLGYNNGNGVFHVVRAEML